MDTPDPRTVTGPAQTPWHTAAQDSAPKPQDALIAFSNGSISRQQAMRKLGVCYSDLLDQLASRNLPIPRVTDEEATRMAAIILALPE